MEEIQRSQAVLARFNEALFIEIGLALIHVNERRPNIVLFLGKHGPRPGKNPKSFQTSVLLTQRDR